MLADRLTIAYDAQFHLISLRLDSTPPQQCSLLLRPGFSLADLHDGVAATGWVAADGDAYRLDCRVRLDFFADVLGSMLNLLDSPQQPSAQLAAVRAAVADEQHHLGSDIDIPDLALAWLDVIVREDIADEARSAESIWSQSQLSLECHSHRQRRIKELLHRYVQPVASGIQPRLAPSRATHAAVERAKSG